MDPTSIELHLQLKPNRILLELSRYHDLPFFILAFIQTDLPQLSPLGSGLLFMRKNIEISFNNIAILFPIFVSQSTTMALISRTLIFPLLNQCTSHFSPINASTLKISIQTS